MEASSGAVMEHDKVLLPSMKVTKVPSLDKGIQVSILYACPR